MDTLLTWIGLGGCALITVAGALAWWEHRKRLLELKRDIALVENSRFLLEEHVRTVDLRLQAMDATLQAQQRTLANQRPAPPPAAAAATPAAAVASAAAATTPDPAPAPAVQNPAPRTDWPDTLPMELDESRAVHYAPTMPMDLAPH